MNHAQGDHRRHYVGLRALLVLALLSGILLMNRPMPAMAMNVTQGDGIFINGQASNTTPQWRSYTNAANTFGAATASTAGAVGNSFVIKTSPTKQEAIAGYISSTGTLQIMCFDGVNWSNEWTTTVYTNGNVRRYDIAYENSSGNVMVMYGTNTATTNELAYRTKPGSASCGSSNWSGATSVDPVRTSSVVSWVHLAADRRSSSNLLTAVWADSSNKLSAMQWSGSAWGNEPATALDTALSNTGASTDIDSFAVDYESVSGDVMVTWGDSAGSHGVNGVRYATCTGGTATCTWSGMLTPPTFADDALTVSLAANPRSDEMVFASIGVGQVLQIGYWSGSAWTDTANADPTTGVVAAKYNTVATGWVTNGSTTKSIVVYRDTDSNVSYFAGTGSTFTVQTDFVPSTVIVGSIQRESIYLDPWNSDRLMLLIGDANNNIWAKRLTMSSGGAFTWTDADGGTALETNVPTSIYLPASFAYWRNGFSRDNTISVTIDPSFSFGVAGEAASCNGVSVSAGTSSSATAVTLGHATTGTNQIAAQDLTVSSNAGGGYTVFLRSNGPLTNAAGATIADTSGSNASPASFSAPGTEAFGYTTSDATLGTGTANRFTNPSAKWAPVTTTNAEVDFNASAITAETQCVGFQFGQSGLTKAGTYSATIVYTALPTF